MGGSGSVRGASKDRPRGRKRKIYEAEGEHKTGEINRKHIKDGRFNLSISNYSKCR